MSKLYSWFLGLPWFFQGLIVSMVLGTLLGALTHNEFVFLGVVALWLVAAFAVALADILIN